MDMKPLIHIHLVRNYLTMLEKDYCEFGEIDIHYIIQSMKSLEIIYRNVVERRENVENGNSG